MKRTRVVDFPDMFSSSSSAFGIKPATNTGTTSLFGQPQQQTGPGQQQSSLFSAFGQNQPQNQPQQSTGVFGQPQPQQTTAGLFGQPQPSGGTFGQTQQQPQQSGLFGQTQQQLQQTTGGLFGQNQQQPQQASGGLFGSAQTQQSAGGLFGQPQQQTQTNQPLFGGSLFGGQQQQQQQQPQQTGLFGSTINASNPLQPQATLPAGAFGTSTTAGTGAFGASLFGTKSQQPQQQPAIQSTGLGPFGQQNTLTTSANAGPPPFTKSTKFNDLPDNTKAVLEQIDTYIQGRIQICKDLQQRKLGDEPTKGHEAIRNIQKDLVNTSTAIRNDLHITQDLKAKVDQAVEDTIVTTRIIDGFRNHQSGNTYLKDHAGFPLEYFSRISDQMKQRLDWYKSTIEQIERKIASAASSTQTPQSVSAIMQAQYATFIALASKTAAVDTELQKIKALYTQLWRAKTGSVRDPFGDVVKPSDKSSDFGFSQLNVR